MNIQCKSCQRKYSNPFAIWRCPSCASEQDVAVNLASTNTAQPAIAKLMKSFFDSQYLSVDGRMAVEAFSEYVQQQQASAQ